MTSNLGDSLRQQLKPDLKNECLVGQGAFIILTDGTQPFLHLRSPPHSIYSSEV
jgi:hypothetical protein